MRKRGEIWLADDAEPLRVRIGASGSLKKDSDALANP